MILSCTCTNSYQDQLYGKGQRVMNEMKREPNQPVSYRCTVCTKIRQVANSTATVVIKKESN